ncbi:MAG: hypothetical protein J2P32_14980 [Actinobacteria bacterium]|nr:hypothetical protein [Actinomycetota bacterium]
MSKLSDEVGVSPEQVDKLASALENLRDVLAANVPTIVNTMGSYWNGGTGQPVNLKVLKQAQARSAGDAADMRARSNLAQAWMSNPANIDLVTGGVAYIPWDTASVNSQDATLDAQRLAGAEKSGNLAEIQAVGKDIRDHLAKGRPGCHSCPASTTRQVRRCPGSPHPCTPRAAATSSSRSWRKIGRS